MILLSWSGRLLLSTLPSESFSFYEETLSSYLVTSHSRIPPTQGFLQEEGPTATPVLSHSAHICSTQLWHPELFLLGADAFRVLFSTATLIYLSESYEAISA